ncbi:hypothetical protein MB46_10440 [Arthrobacter alpinus]|uniref:hypothetical protein n=1 Tax=Arthrobacter alpinus TaxID=656366 RepID=UPI0005CB74F8|nr:hypothetical protein [Arthrobacter alpinus]ALV45839.1 hypothetical protein MB46_10440 [Arthrobacter alpinus]
MTLQGWLTIAGIVVTAVFSYGASRYAGRASVKVKEVEVDAAAYERAESINAAMFKRLQEEVSALKESHEAQGDKLRILRDDLDKVTHVFRISMNFIERFLLWARDGSLPPIPSIPEQLREHLDPSLIREHGRQQEQNDRL